MSSLHYSELCRLCLVNERVSIPIFDGESGIQSLCLKIGTCLPIKISPEDILPKNICNDCFYKVENQYQFWISTANAEKQLLQWFSNATSIPEDDKGLVALAANQNNLKTEMDIDPSSELSKSLSQVEAVLAGDASNVPEEEDEDEEEESEEEGSNSEESDDDGDNGDADDGAKDDGDTDEAYDEELEPTTFVNVSFECDEAGPSGTQQQGPPTAPSTSTSAPAASGSPGEILPINRAETVRNGNAVTKLDQDPLSEARGNSHTRPCALCHDAISKHLVTVEGIKKMKCCSCGTLVRNHSNTLHNHVGTHLESSKRTCTVCGKTRASAISLKMHMLVHKEVRPFACGVCDKTFPTEYKLKQHTFIHGTSKRYACDECEYSTHHLHAIEAHKRRSHLRTFICGCTVCGRGFYTTTELKAHMNTHTGDKPFVCDICGKPFPYLGSMKEHRLSHDPNRPASKPAQCDTCGKILSCKSALNAHRRLLHTGENVHICDVCGKSVTTKTSLKDHSLIHTDEYPYSCDVCQKAFKKTSTLAVHKRSHTGVKPYTCEECGKKFTQSSTLVVHKRIHSGERPHKCHVCVRAFVTKTLLKTHLKIHGTASADIVITT